MAHDERAFMLTAIAEIKPRDAVERMLANADNIDQVQAHYSGYNKLARTYSMQMETLRKHRNGGKQTVVVQHVNVADGAQAVIGNVQTGGRADD